MNRNFHVLRVIEDADAIEQAEALRAVVSESEIYFNTTWLAKKQFVTVPIENLGFFDEAQSDRLAQAANAIGVRQCLAVATEDWGDLFPKALHVPATPDGFNELSGEIAACPYLLVAEQEKFAVLCTSTYFNVLAGPPSFVQAAIEGGIESARRWFRQTVDEWKLPEDVAFYKSIAERYERASEVQ
jgi:hypothetical protein